MKEEQKRAYHHANLREELIQAGIAILNHDGIEALSLRRIAAACDVSHAAPYRHFKNKEELMEAMQLYVETSFAEFLETAVNRYQHATRPMLEFGKAYVAFFTRHPEYYTFFTQYQKIDVYLSEKKQEAISTYRPFQIFRQQADYYFKRHPLPTDEYIQALITFWSAVHGLAGMAVMTGIHYDGNWQTMTEKILKGVLPNERKTNID